MSDELPTSPPPLPGMPSPTVQALPPPKHFTGKRSSYNQNSSLNIIDIDFPSPIPLPSYDVNPSPYPSSEPPPLPSRPPPATHPKSYKSYISNHYAKNTNIVSNSNNWEDDVNAESTLMIRRDGDLSQLCDELLAAVTAGDLSKVKSAIDSGARVDWESESGLTSIRIAANEGYLNIINLLIEHHVNVNSVDKCDGNTALLLASRNGFLAGVKVLVVAGANLNCRNMNGDTALDLAICGGYDDIERYLCKVGAKSSVDDLVECCMNGELESVKSILSCKIPSLVIDKQDSFLHRTPLLATALAGHVHILHELLRSGADVDIRSGKLGDTALISAARGGHVPIVVMLLSAGADAGLENLSGETALIASVASRKVECVRILVSRGWDPSMETSRGVSAQALAEMLDDKEILNIFKESVSELKSMESIVSARSNTLLSNDNNEPQPINPVLGVNSTRVSQSMVREDYIGRRGSRPPVLELEKKKREQRCCETGCPIS